VAAHPQTQASIAPKAILATRLITDKIKPRDEKQDCCTSAAYLCCLRMLHDRRARGKCG